MPHYDASRRRKAIQQYATPEYDGERSFENILDARTHALVCAIIEQAVYDWQSTDYGKVQYRLGRNSNALLFSKEVEKFFQSKWFEYLLGFALPQYTPEYIRKHLRIAEPERSVRERHLNTRRD